MPLQRFASMPSMSQYHHQQQHFLSSTPPLGYSTAPHLNFTYQNPMVFTGYQQTTMPIPPQQYPIGQTLVSPFGSFGNIPLSMSTSIGNGLQIPPPVGPVMESQQRQYLMATPPGINKRRPMPIDGNDNKRANVGNVRNLERDSAEDSDTLSSNTEDDEDQEETKSSGASTMDSNAVARVKGPWTIKEDARLKQFVKQYGKRWSLVAEKLPGRIGKQCRERWLNHLDPKINRAPWTPEEDRILLSKQKALGNRWSEIAKLLPGRPENSVKNRFTSLSQRTFGV